MTSLTLKLESKGEMDKNIIAILIEDFRVKIVLQSLKETNELFTLLTHNNLKLELFKN